MPRMRTVPEAFNELKERDPDTAITFNAFDRLVKTGQIPCVRIGIKRVVNMDIVERFFNSEFTNICSHTKTNFPSG